MAKNFVQHGDRLNLLVGSTDGPNGDGVITSGDVVKIATLIVVAQTSGTYANGDTVACAACGVFYLPKATTSSSAIAQGTKVYWDAAGKKITATASGNTYAGVCWAPNADGDAVVAVRLTEQ